MEKRNRFVFQPIMYTVFSVISEDFSCYLNINLSLPSHTLSYEPVRSQLTFFYILSGNFLGCIHKFISFIFYLPSFSDDFAVNCLSTTLYQLPYIIHITLSQAFSSNFFIGLSESTNTLNSLSCFFSFFLLLCLKLNTTCFRLLLWQQPSFRYQLLHQLFIVAWQMSPKFSGLFSRSHGSSGCFLCCFPLGLLMCSSSCIFG